MAEARTPHRLQSQDIARLVAAGRRMGFPLGPVVEAMALTAAPPKAVRFMRWADIDRDAATWTPRPHAGEPVVGPVPLVPDMRKLLDAVPQNGHAHVFAGPRGKVAADSPDRRRVLARAAGLPDFELADLWCSLRADLRHPEDRETLEAWAALLRDLLKPAGEPERAPLRGLAEDPARVDPDTGTVEPRNRLS